MADLPASPETFTQFVAMFPTDDACIEYVAKWRWPDGFVCPRCASTHHTRLRTRQIWECRNCGYQASVMAGTALQHTKVSPRVWLYALWLIARRKVSTSALQFQRETGIGSYRTAWALLQKVRHVLIERDDFPLKRVVEVDETILEGEGMRGKKLGKNGAFIVAAVERRTRKGRGGVCSGSARAAVIPNLTAATLCGFIEHAVEPGSKVATDGWYPYRGIVARGYDHDIHEQRPQGRHRSGEPALKRTHLLFSNLKSWLVGTFHGVTVKYLSAYVDEFIYRFNRRARDPETFGYVLRRLVSAKWTGIVALCA